MAMLSLLTANCTNRLALGYTGWWAVKIQAARSMPAALPYEGKMGVHYALAILRLGVQNTSQPQAVVLKNLGQHQWNNAIIVACSVVALHE